MLIFSSFFSYGSFVKSNIRPISQTLVKPVLFITPFPVWNKKKQPKKRRYVLRFGCFSKTLCQIQADNFEKFELPIGHCLRFKADAIFDGSLQLYELYLNALAIQVPCRLS